MSARNAPRSVQTQASALIAARRQHIAQLRSTRAQRHLTIRAACEAAAAISWLRGVTGKFQIGGAL